MLFLMLLLSIIRLGNSKSLEELPYRLNLGYYCPLALFNTTPLSPMFEQEAT